MKLQAKSLRPGMVKTSPIETLHTHMNKSNTTTKNESNRGFAVIFEVAFNEI